jgi:hypothetical protein
MPESRCPLLKSVLFFVGPHFLMADRSDFAEKSL